MKSVIEELVNESLRREIPVPVTRSVNVKRLPGKVSVLIGMRRTGKTWLCFQRMRELLAQGVAREQLLYLNFEDDRLAGLSVRDLKWICLSLPRTGHRKQGDTVEEASHNLRDAVELFLNVRERKKSPGG